ncbi:hypothetical protein GCM10022197_26150 [Microlunatus spumicola]|uniref:Uncharacterized protein n=1 Tax=Microlunatus spumicola TaxID=81499 RepID=A0ABP6XQY7_9ACTN
MRVDIRSGGDGVACWNGDAVRVYAAGVTEREDRLRSANPDLVVTAGQVKCYGCEVMDHGYGTRCTAVLTHPLYSVEGEIGPRPQDAAGSLLEVAGFVSKIETPAELEEPAPALTRAEDNGTTGATTVRGGLRRLIGR